MTVEVAESRIREFLAQKCDAETVMERLMELGREYQLEADADYLEAARMFAEEAALISRMREQLDAEGLTVNRETRGGDYLCAHPLLTELPRHISCAGNTLSTIGEMILRRGARREQKTGLAAFRLA